ncbi:polysaccharide deacetylase family protein [Paenibacillus sp. UNC451MF]|uniref:polysaccharide deacetylase family protein n=1 Tax=Paenibacillus sp. UNC451MF TaxID=1449063 RepID=UPI0005602FB0|nr:polysaccharide deacetylase family protein [Paenibacillus sp. UNC451MF]
MAFTVDVEDWFCSPELTLDEWERLELRIERPIYQILDLLDEQNAKGTFFVLGWIAEKRPYVVKEIARRGHEIASHGYSHRLVYQQSTTEFREDIRKSKHILEQITGMKVDGYRAPCFSITEPALDILSEEGFLYDSSVIPNTLNALYSKFNLAPSLLTPFKIKDNLWEIPMPVLNVGRVNIPWGGGGYFRIYPYRMFNRGARSIINNQGSFIFYTHPYDLDEGQPQIFNTSWINSIRRYYGLKHTAMKLRRLISHYSCTSIREYHSHIFEGK